mmetsp:Transcript_8595/g.17499  ORF Transcript_8595/g.17499 Transcript_8595/m.17499 type:complete len:822 (+) Transcript_8595:687-3152(+)
MASAGRQRPSGSAGRASYGQGGVRAGGDPVPFGATQGRSEEKEREICRTAIYGIVSFDPVRPPRRNDLNATQYVAKYGRPRMVPELPVQATTTEAAFFQRARAHLTRKELLPDKSPLSRRHTPHTEFLKCLHLFGAGILNRDELLLLLKGLFMQGHAPKSGVNAGGGAANAEVAAAANRLVKELEQILIGRGPYAEQQRRTKDDSKYGSVPARDYDYSEAEQPTPSYRTLPSDVPKKSFFSHSGQSDADAAVLNDTVVCVPSRPPNGNGSKKKLWESAEDYDGIKRRKNFYEEAMAKAEDDHFEVDMAIERNSAAKRQVEPLAEEAALLRENEEKDGQPIGRLRYKLRSRSLSSNHIGAIARLYGDRGDEVLHHLGRNPLCVLPIVWRRLNEKDQEWRKARTVLTKEWRQILEDNQEGSRDVQCYFDRKEVDRCLSTNNILDQCERAKYFAEHSGEQNVHTAVKLFMPEFATSCHDPSALLFQPHLLVAMSNSMPHKDACQCLVSVLASGTSKSSSDREKASRMWAEFVVPWFVPTDAVAKEQGEPPASDNNAVISGDETSGGGAALLDPSHKILFGTEKVYICLRLYSHLVSVLAMARDLLGEGEPPHSKNSGEDEPPQSKSSDENMPDEVSATAMSPSLSPMAAAQVHSVQSTSPGHPGESAQTADEDEPKDEKPKYTGYSGLLAVLKDYLSGGLNYATYEMWCRTLSNEKVTEFASIPRLLNKIADSLVRVAKEDSLPRLYGLARPDSMNDPVLLRTQSLNVCSDATYRIQYHPSDADGYISFTFLPTNVELLTAPSSGDADVGESLEVEPSAKRMKI